MRQTIRLGLQSLEPRCLLAGATDLPPSVFTDGVELHLETQTAFVPGYPLLVRVELRDTQGAVLRDLWDADVRLSTDRADVSLSSDQVQLHNGLGSVLTVPSTSDAFILEAQFGQQSVTRRLEPIMTPTRTLQGILTEDTRLSGLVRIADDVTIPEDISLSLAPGTIVLVDGLPRENGFGKGIHVQGSLVAEGTEQQPVVFTAMDAAAPWAEIDVDGGRLFLRHASIHRAGNSLRGGHTATGPALRLRNQGTIEMDHANVTDIAGKILQSSGGQIQAADSLWSRAVMGPEIEDTALLMERSWIVQMAGQYRHDGKVDDNDGIYLHRQQPDQRITLRDGVVADVQDDGIDTLDSTILVENYIVRDVDDKALSVFDGQATILRSLLVDAEIGVETKGARDSRPVTYIRQSTIANVNIGINAKDKGSPDPDVVITYDVADSIIQVLPGGTGIRTDYDPDDLHVNSSLLPSEWNANGSGQGNLVGDAMFVAAANGNFRLRMGSPAIDGATANLKEADGSILDLGFYTTALDPGGDLSSNGVTNAGDVDILCDGIRRTSLDGRLDLNRDGRVSVDDLDQMIHDILRTTAGDANLDGIFNSADLLAVFQAGHYDDAAATDIGWAQGDWNCDGKFNSADLIKALQSGAYRL